MNNYLLSFAKYHGTANDMITTIFDGLTREQLTADRGSFAKTLEGLYSHLVGGDTFFIGVLGKTLPKLAISIDDAKDLTFEEAKAIVARQDQLYLNIVEALNDEDLAVVLDFYGHPTTVEHLLLRAFNHAIHHRGQISQILDEMQIAHDWATSF